MKSKKSKTFLTVRPRDNRTCLRNAMTIPEVFIVVLIMALIAAVSAPKFSQAKASNDLSRLIKNLEMIRQQIKLYQVQHEGLLPGQQKEGEEITEEEFVKALTQSDGVYGPYLKEIPANPFNGLNTVRIGSVTLGSAAGAGWFFNSSNGDFRADDLGYHRAY